MTSWGIIFALTLYAVASFKNLGAATAHHVLFIYTATINTAIDNIAPWRPLEIFLAWTFANYKINWEKM